MPEFHGFWNWFGWFLIVFVAVNGTPFVKVVKVISSKLVRGVEE